MRNRDDILFYEGELYAVLDNLLGKVKEKVDSIPAAQFIATQDDEVVEYVVSEMEVLPLELQEEDREMERRETKVDVTGDPRYFPMPGDRVIVDGVEIVISIPYTGHSALWKLKPNRHPLRFPHGTIRKIDDTSGFLLLRVTRPTNTAAEEILKSVNDEIDILKDFLKYQRELIDQNNRLLPLKAKQYVEVRRANLSNLDKISKTLNIPLKHRAGVPEVIPMAVKRRLIKPLPPAPSSPPEPGIRNEDYEHILSVIRHEGRTFEATPQTFAVHNEEELRDIILAHLNGHYEGDATGEAFRKKGKTDIRIEMDNRAAFVGECKVWRGDAELLEASDQLLGYLTWRDCKVSLIIFNKAVAGFAKIQEKVPDILKQHQHFVRELKSEHAGEWRFIFRSAEDPNRHITVHVFLFDLCVKQGKD